VARGFSLKALERQGATFSCLCVVFVMSWTFFREFLTNWQTTGAVAPSSSGLARRMMEAAHVAQAKCLLELGPGTGAFTRQIESTLPKGSRYLGLDMNPTFIETLRRRFPLLRFEKAPAQDFDYESFLSGEGFDAIVCGLPWTAFPESLQTAILDRAFSVLKPGGIFATFAYTGFHRLPRGQKFRELLAGHCAQLSTTATVWRNLPPAFVYRALK
jgi:phospholipid N-methyltransferase